MTGLPQHRVLFLAGLALGCFALSTPLSAQPPTGKFAIDRDRAMFDRIEDGAPVRSETQNPDEYAAYNFVLAHARQFPVADLEAAARRDVTFKDLFLPVRKDFKLELVYLEGRLRRFRSIGPTRQLREAGIHHLYEGWIFPREQPNPICVLTTECPEGLSPQVDLSLGEIDVPVGIAGYSFKLMNYESQEANPRDPNRGRVRQAPLILGHSFSVLAQSGHDPSADWHGTFLPTMMGGLAVIAMIGIGLALWYRRGDRYWRTTLEARRQDNPFDA